MALRPPIVIGHRGAPGHRPEHTLASYVLAARLGADHLEPDLVATADGVLVARHEPDLSGTTDVARHPEFADRHTTRVIDGVARTGWFVDDFTLAELRTLRAVERRSSSCAPGSRRGLGRTIGVYPETKKPGYFAARGVPLEPALVGALQGAGLDSPAAPVFVQSFDCDSLRLLRSALRVPLVRLVDHDTPALVAPGNLAATAAHVDAVGVHKNLVIPWTPDGARPSTLVADAHALGLAVHAFTFRDENAFLPAGLRRGAEPAALGDGLTECAAFVRAGVDGLFADNPATAVAARELAVAAPGG